MDEMWNPDSADWYEATIISVSKGHLILNASLSNGDTVFIWNSRVTQALGGHTLCVPEGTLCHVRLERGSAGQLKAVECWLVGDDSRPSTIEKVVVLSWSDEKGFGTAVRPCGCPVFVVGRRGLFVQEGDEFIANIEPSEKKPGLMVAFPTQRVGSSVHESD